MNDIFCDLLDVSVIIYMDDILIYSVNQDEHDQHVWMVLEHLRLFKLYVKLEKCLFDQTEVEFWGYKISSQGISIDSSKVDHHSPGASQNLFMIFNPS